MKILHRNVPTELNDASSAFYWGCDVSFAASPIILSLNMSVSCHSYCCNYEIVFKEKKAIDSPVRV